jgi:Tfp pilus assembly protein PilX
MKIKQMGKYMKTRKNKGAVLITAMLILSLILIIALSIAATTIRERKASMSASKSNIALQNAQRGLEEILKDIDNAVNSCASTCCGGASPCTAIQCSGAACRTTDLDYCQNGGKIRRTGIYEATLIGFNGNNFSCRISSRRISDIAEIEVIGYGPGEQRAIRAGVNDAPSLAP